jgi:hypothetical protein
MTSVFGKWPFHNKHFNLATIGHNRHFNLETKGHNRHFNLATIGPLTF